MIDQEQYGNSTTLLFNHDDMQLLRVVAAIRGFTVNQLVGRAVHVLLVELEIKAALEQPEEAFMALDGAIADRLGAATLERAARRYGLRFEVVGGKHHDGKKFGS